jgi:hypothetical protein
VRAGRPATVGTKRQRARRLLAPLHSRNEHLRRIADSSVRAECDTREQSLGSTRVPKQSSPSPARANERQHRDRIRRRPEEPRRVLSRRDSAPRLRSWASAWPRCGSSASARPRDRLRRHGRRVAGASTPTLRRQLVGAAAVSLGPGIGEDDGRAGGCVVARLSEYAGRSSMGPAPVEK